jgi:Putative restriction endonuclease
MTVEMVAPAWMHQQVTAEQYAAWTEEQCAGIENRGWIVFVSPSPSKRHNRLARLLANALDVAAGPDWNADTDFDVRLQDMPLNNRRPDVRVYRAETIDVYSHATGACAPCGRGGLNPGTLFRRPVMSMRAKWVVTIGDDGPLVMGPV